MKLFYKLLFKLFEISRVQNCVRELNMKPRLHKFHGYSIFYLEKDGSLDYPTLVLVHGLLDLGFGFRKLIKHLHYPGRILVPDLPGYGRSHLPRMGYLYQLDIFSDLLIHWLDSIHLSNSQVILCGHSMGGLIVQKMALSWKKSFQFKIHKLILLASGGIPHPKRDEMKNVLFPKSIQDINILFQYLYHSRFPEPHSIILKTLLNEWNGWKNQMLAVNTISREVEIFHGDKVKEIKYPTLIIVGEEDELTTLKMMKKINKWILGSKLQILKETKHGLHNEKPEQVAHSIREFLGL